MNKAQKMQLESWKRIKEQENISVIEL